jgi:hypothetical protein
MDQIIYPAFVVVVMACLHLYTVWGGKCSSCKSLRNRLAEETSVVPEQTNLVSVKTFSVCFACGNREFKHERVEHREINMYAPEDNL